MTPQARVEAFLAGCTRWASSVFGAVDDPDCIRGRVACEARELRFEATRTSFRVWEDDGAYIATQPSTDVDRSIAWLTAAPPCAHTRAAHGDCSCVDCGRWLDASARTCAHDGARWLDVVAGSDVAIVRCVTCGAPLVVAEPIVPANRAAPNATLEFRCETGHAIEELAKVERALEQLAEATR